MSDNPQDKNAMPSADDMAAAALGTTADPGAGSSASPADETAASDELAQTLSSLQNLIERHARELNRISEELKHKREGLKNVFENDTELGEAVAQAEIVSQQLKDRKAKLQTDPQVTTLKVQIGELNEQKKEIEETLSNHLVSYYSMTRSTSFDTSDGDQWEFNIRAKVKPRKGDGGGNFGGE